MTFIKGVGYSIMGCWALGAMSLFVAVPGLVFGLYEWVMAWATLALVAMSCAIPLVIIGGIYNIVTTGDVIGR